jgi:NAD(P)-dependent dehydrogenase (short-subunit alcohol dehydrogenase family)
MYVQVGDFSLTALTGMLVIATYQAIPGSTLYTTAKFAQLGIVRCLDRLVAKAGINTAVVSPLLPSGMAPTALADVIVYAANEANLSKAGAGYFISEDGSGSVRIAMQDTVREGGYGEMDARLDKISGLPSLMPR